MNDIFTQKNNSRYNLRKVSEFSEIDSVSFLRPKIRDMLPDDYKDIDNLNTFKNKFQKSGNCPC